MTQLAKDFRILIIDDNPSIHVDFIKILTAESSKKNRLSYFENKIFGPSTETKPSLPRFQINSASQGHEGIEKISAAIKEGNPFALAFVDVRMPPGIDGIETTKKIWELDRDIQIVICTAFSDYTWEETVEKLGQRENLLILKKPFDNVAVRQLTCALTKKWQLLQESREYTRSLEERIEERTKSLQESLSISRGTLESSADGIIVANNDNKVIDYNKNFVEMFNVPQTVLDAADMNLILEYISAQMEKSDDFLKMMHALSFRPDAVKIDRLQCNDGRFFEHYTQSYKLDEKITGRIWSFRDITKRAILEQKLQYQATHDILTQLPNRVLLTDRLHQILSHAKREHEIFCVLFLDIDKFKLVNDSFSHMIGDQLLQEVAKRLSPIIREEDTLARIGGDEFVIILNSLKDERDAAKIADKLLNIFLKPFSICEHQLLVTPSIGISVFPYDGQDIDELLRNADVAMYCSKENGGNQFQFFTAALGQRSLARLELETDLRRAIENEEFFLYYQPLFDLKTKKLSSVEALIRWQHPTKGVILPINFIPLAEETGLIVPIGEWVLRSACKQNKKWQDLGLPKIRVGVNIATKQLKQPNLCQIIEDVLRESGLPPEYLELEITENVMINSIEAAKTFNKLREMGIHFALDDFGSGYSSLNYLRIFPIDRLKIDHSFINNISLNTGDEVIIQAIISMAKNLNLNVVAEGVESKNQMDFLQSNSCNEVQGFYFSKLLSAEEFENFLRNPDTFKKSAG